jgi:predicted hydrocarbon binding protein
LADSRLSSGYFYPNRIGRAYLQALEEVMGPRGLKAVLNFARLPQWIDNLPSDNLALGFPFEDFAGLNQAVDDMYGMRGGRGLTVRAGRAAFDQGLRDFGTVVGVADRAFKLLPLHIRLNVGLKAMAKVFSQFSDQTSRVEDRADHFVYIIERCPVCWSRQAERPICYSAVGLLEAGIEWGTGRKYKVIETSCIAMGAQSCTFAVPKEPAS